MRHDVFAADELAPGQMVGTTVDGVAIVVVRDLNGELHALRDTCPHRRAKLSSGRVMQAMRADELGEYEMSDVFIVRCPYHGYEFDVTDGKCLADPTKVFVKTYDVHVEQGRVIVER